MIYKQALNAPCRLRSVFWDWDWFERLKEFFWHVNMQQVKYSKLKRWSCDSAVAVSWLEFGCRSSQRWDAEIRPRTFVMWLQSQFQNCCTTNIVERPTELTFWVHVFSLPGSLLRSWGQNLANLSINVVKQQIVQSCFICVASLFWKSWKINLESTDEYLGLWCFWQLFC